MVEAVRRVIHHLVLLACVVASPCAGAHVLDEYLQATLVEIAPEGIRLQVNLTPGAEVAGPIVGRMDADGDGAISAGEGAAYAESFKRDLQARLDDRPVELRVVGSHFPAPSEMREGVGIVQIELAIEAGSLAAGEHRLVVENRHEPQVSVYLFNAAWPASSQIKIRGQKRNENQSRGEIAFSYQPPVGASRTSGTMVAMWGVIAAGVAGTGIWWTRKGLFRRGV